MYHSSDHGFSIEGQLPAASLKPAKSAPKFSRRCRECDAAFEASRPDARFCASACRMAFNNRRSARGAELYDLFMMMRNERGLAKAKGVWSLMCRIAEQWREEDKKDRAGRPSWTPYEELAGTGRFVQFAYITRMWTRPGR